jgi:cytochrome c oxidase subunit 2
MYPITPGVSNLAEGVDKTFMILFAISLFFLIGITIVMIWFVFRYHKKRHPVPSKSKGNNTLEVIWIVFPTIIVLILFYYGWIGFKPMRDVPEGAREVKVIGYMWDWDFEYENGKRSKDLYLAKDEPVKLNMVSLDVIHSLYIPAFRVKEDVVPGQTNFMWFIPSQVGQYEVLCAEYCGLRHSFMDAKAYVMEPQEFQTWLADFNPEEKEHKGLIIVRNNACTGCHSLDGSKLVGSTFKGLYNADRKVTEDGKLITVKADDEYLLESIYEPNRKLVEGYPANVMQSYRKIITDEDVMHIIDWLKSEEMR